MSSVSCSICWEIVTSTCVASYLLCGHVYHRNCLDKWLGTSKTCPECRNAVTDSKRIYLNLVPDPEIEVLHSELIRKRKEYEFLSTDNDIQVAIIKQLEKQISSKDRDLRLSIKRNDELQSNNSSTLHKNDKLKLELEMQQKQQIFLTTEIADLRQQLEVSQTKNIEITNSTVALKEFHREQVNQISHLQSEIINLTERLDQFRGLFVAANSKLEMQVQENQVIREERDSLTCRNVELIQEVNNLLEQVNDKLLQKMNNEYVKTYTLPSEANGGSKKKRKMVHCPVSKENLKIEFAKSTQFPERQNSNLNKVLWRPKLHQVSNKNLKIKLVKSRQDSDENLKIKLVKSKLNWMCVKD